MLHVPSLVTTGDLAEAALAQGSAEAEGRRGQAERRGARSAHQQLLAMLRGVAALTFVVGVSSIVEARPIVLSCRRGVPDSDRVRGLDVGDRRYPFCQFQTELDGDLCRFTFCPSLGYVIGCSLDPLCLAPYIDCATPGVTREEFEVELRHGGQRPGRLVLQRGGRRIVLKCRPVPRVVPPPRGLP